MIKPVTFQGQFNFNANLYALEVKSRFIDQNNAHGYYTGYGDELAATIVGGNKIQIGAGAFVVCGRMSEITAAEIVQPQIFDGFKGYVVARIETFHPADEGNVTIIAKVQTSWEALNRELEQNDVYASTADNVNTAYELPIYSFEISGTQITNLVKLIKPVCDYATIKTIVDNALATAQSAVATANGAVSTANAAKAAADKATADVADLAEQIAEGQGTSVTLNGVPQATFPADDLMHDGDKAADADHADAADVADTAAEADTAQMTTYAFLSAEAEKAVGYTRGGEIDKTFKKIFAAIAALQGGN